MLVDAHAHLDKYADDEIDAVLRAIDERHILTMSVSEDGPSYVRTEAIAARSDFIVPAFGIHPWRAPAQAGSLDEVEELAERTPMIGEIGLDHRFVTDEACHGPQRRVFARLLEIARDQGKLVNVHCAGAERDTAEMLRAHRMERAIIHWYAGPLDVLSEMVADGFMFTVGVEVLHSDHVRDVARAIPADQILSETDNPGGHRWLTGSTGYPRLISDVVTEVARVRGSTVADLLATVEANVTRLVADDDHLAPWSARLHG